MIYFCCFSLNKLHSSWIMLEQINMLPTQSVCRGNIWCRRFHWWHQVPTGCPLPPSCHLFSPCKDVRLSPRCLHPGACTLPPVVCLPWTVRTNLWSHDNKIENVDLLLQRCGIFMITMQNSYDFVIQYLNYGSVYFQMHRSAKCQAPPNAVDFLWSCEGLWKGLSFVFSMSVCHLII